MTEALREIIAEKNLTGKVGVVGSLGKTGRNSINDQYVDELLHHKIVVVCQRDHWEDHLRLMEGFVSGAMVMSDPITHMPSGFQDGESIVIYHSLNDLKEKLLHYLREDMTAERLRIAKAGRKLAIQHHKTRQSYERMIVGTWPQDFNDPVIKNLKK